MIRASRDSRLLLVAVALVVGSVFEPAAAQTTTDSTACSACVDVSIGSDGNSRLLQFEAATGQMTLESVNSAGVVTQAGPFGPYAGWTARAIASGDDSLTRVLWTHSDGSTALWLVAPLGVAASFRYPATAGLAAIDVAAGADSDTHILSIRADGAAVIQTIDAAGNVTRSFSLGPYAGWRATAISDGPDGLTRILWNNQDGRVGLSLASSDGLLTTARYGPDAGWTALDLAVGGDGLTRILRANADGRVTLWIVNAAGEITVNGPVYAAPGGMAAHRLTAATDGSSRILFTSDQGGAAFWSLASDGVYQQSFAFKGTPPPEGTTTWDFVLQVTAVAGPDFCIWTPSVGTVFETTYVLQRNADSISFLHPQDPIDWSEYTATLDGANVSATITYASGAGMCAHYLETNSFSGSFSADGSHLIATETWSFTLDSGQVKTVTFHWSGSRQ